MMEEVNNVLDPSGLGLTSECELPLDIVKEELDTEDFDDVNLEQHLDGNSDISVDNIKEEIEELVDTDVRNTERDNEVQDVIVGPRYTTHTVEEGSAYQTLTKANRNGAAEDNNVKREISPNAISSIRSTNSSKGTKQFSCDTCQKHFTTKYQFTRHVCTHTAEKTYKCWHCMKYFDAQETLKLHIIRSHTSVKPYQCSDCMKCFYQKSRLITHIRSHTGCRTTERETEEQDVTYSPCTSHPVEEERIHKITSSNSNSAADDSKVNFKISANEISSIQSTNTSKGTKRFSCDTCQKRFSCDTCQKRFSCDTCQKRFTYKYMLTRHVRTHTGEKPYQCCDCLKCFNQKSDLNKHIRTHTGENPYQCSDCKKCFSRKIHLITHNMRLH